MFMETVLGIFCKQPIPGMVKTRLASDIGEMAAARLYEAFLNDIVERMSGEADRRILCYAPDDPAAHSYFESLGGDDYGMTPQVPGDLGERLSAFFQAAVVDNRQRAIVIGSDSPTLSVQTIRTSFGELQKTDAVLGRSDDGGYYLVGLGDFHHRLFEGIDWSTSAVYDQQLRNMEGVGFSVTTLPAVPDIDTVDDLQELRHHPQLKHCSHTHRVLQELDLL